MEKPDNHGERPDERLEAPPKLVAALQRLAKEPVFIPRTLDEAVLLAAQRQLGEKRKPALKWFRILSWAAAASMLALLAAVLPQILRKSGSAPVRGSRFALEDLNHDGRVDILDAFALARQLKAGKPSDLRFDINEDGVVDERDVARIAAHAVSLDKGGRS
jgi:hypothetical protein